MVKSMTDQHVPREQEGPGVGMACVSPYRGQGAKPDLGHPTRLTLFSQAVHSLKNSVADRIDGQQQSRESRSPRGLWATPPEDASELLGSSWCDTEWVTNRGTEKIPCS